ncbi:unnamed protein product, partial [Rotaria magnacalcarata]
TTPAKELNDYMKFIIPDEESDDVLLFWKNHEKFFPTLSKIVRDLYAISASNTFVERLFSASKNIVTDRRTTKLNKNEEQSKQRLSIPDGESVVIIEDVGSVTASPTSKRMKPNDDDGDILYDIEHMHDSKEPDNIFLNLLF